jgi:nitroimidazol reductase NimA-like FMN-containing flavoprotein (pyridoxamine 5'-phosphate oxidase superfamily)
VSKPTVDVDALGVLPRDECLRLLESEEIGRVAVNWTTGPLVVPVNYRVVGDSIVFRSGPGTKLRAFAVRPVSFQVDRFDGERREGWSVLVRGRAQEVSARQFSHLRLEPWAPGDKEHLVRMQIVAVSGRRITRAVDEPTSDPAPLS